MSIRIMSEVWEHSRHGGAHLLLLLKLADRANDDGVCWPGHTSLAKAARISRRKAIDKLAEIEESGEVVIGRRGELAKKGEKGKYRDTNIYVVLVACDQAEMARRITEANKMPGLTMPLIGVGSDPLVTRGSEHGVTTLVSPPSLGVVNMGSHESSVETSSNHQEDSRPSDATTPEATYEHPVPPKSHKQDLLYEAVYGGVEGTSYITRQSPHSGLAARLTKALRAATLDRPDLVTAYYQSLRADNLSPTTSEDKLVTAIRKLAGGLGQTVRSSQDAIPTDTRAADEVARIMAARKEEAGE